MLKAHGSRREWQCEQEINRGRDVPAEQRDRETERQRDRETERQSLKSPNNKCTNTDLRLLWGCDDAATADGRDANGGRGPDPGQRGDSLRRSDIIECKEFARLCELEDEGPVGEGAPGELEDRVASLLGSGDLELDFERVWSVFDARERVFVEREDQDEAGG